MRQQSVRSKGVSKEGAPKMWCLLESADGDVWRRPEGAALCPYGSRESRWEGEDIVHMYM